MNPINKVVIFNGQRIYCHTDKASDDSLRQSTIHQQSDTFEFVGQSWLIRGKNG